MKAQAFAPLIFIIIIIGIIVISSSLFVVTETQQAVITEFGKPIKEVKEPGRYEVVWDASNVASGVYIYQLRIENYVNNKKMILLK